METIPSGFKLKHVGEWDQTYILTYVFSLNLAPFWLLVPGLAARSAAVRAGAIRV
jgi:hypothetical protein